MFNIRNMTTLVAAIALCFVAAHAQDFDLNWYTIDGGGVMFSKAGAFELSGTWDCEDDNRAHYGRLDLAYPKFQPYLRPTDPIYVNRAYGKTEKGTVKEPFNTVLEGVFAVRRGSNIHIERGAYKGRVTIDKAMTLNARNGDVTIGR